MAGNRSDDAGAVVEQYDPSRNGAEYALKFAPKEDGDWSFRNLELFHPEARGLQDTTRHFQRRQRRHEARQKTFGVLRG
jgi:hypothetical protein